MDAVTYYLTIAPIWLLPTLAIATSVITFYFTGISFLHWVAMIFWFICGYYFFQLGMDRGLTTYHIIGVVAGVFGMIMAFAPFFLTAKKETMVDQTDYIDRYNANVDRVMSPINKIRSMRKSTKSTRGSDGFPVV